MIGVPGFWALPGVLSKYRRGRVAGTMVAVQSVWTRTALLLAVLLVVQRVVQQAALPPVVRAVASYGLFAAPFIWLAIDLAARAQAERVDRGDRAIGLLGAAGAGLGLVGHFLATWTQSTLAWWFFGIAIPAAALGLVLMGISLIRTRGWPAWMYPLLALATGVYVWVVGFVDPERASLVLGALAWAAVGDLLWLRWARSVALAE